MILFAERAEDAGPVLPTVAERGSLAAASLLLHPAETPGTTPGRSRRIHAWREAVRDAEMLARANGQLLSVPATPAMDRPIHEVPTIGAHPATGIRAAYRRLERSRAAVIVAAIQLLDRLGAPPWPTTHTDRTKAGRVIRQS